MSLLVKNAKAFVGGELIDTNILCSDGKIVELASSTPHADEVLDVKGKTVLPGLIDPHVHFRDPGFTHKEDFHTGTSASAAGGITTIIDMPNTMPPVTTVKALEAKRKAIAGKSVVNYGLHFGAAADNIEEIKQAQEHHNIASVKVYCDVTTGNLKIPDVNIVKDIFAVMPVTTLHAENEHVSQTLRHLENTMGSAYYAHISSKQELNDARARPDLNHRVFVEVTPQHLFLTENDVKKQKGFAEMKPHLKTKNDMAALWEGIANGTVTTVGTDHAPHTKEEKKQDPYPFGIPGEETVLPLLLDSVHQDRLKLSRVVQLCCENPAKIFGLKTKGIIGAGFDADLTIVDMDKKKKVVGDKLQTKCKWSPFEGKLLKGWPTTTIVDGEVVYNDGTITKTIGKEVTYEH